MNGNRDTFLNNNSKRILFVLFAFVMFYLISFLIDPYSEYFQTFFQRPLEQVSTEVVFSLFFCFLISESSIYINSRFNNYLSWIERPIMRMTLQSLVHTLITLLIILMEILLSYFVFGDKNWEPSRENITGFWQWIIVSVFIALMISGINTVNYLISNWKKTALEAAEYKQAAVEAELQALKLQVDPHFVFNNLSVLSELILEDQQLGYDYAENFSKVYRYLLLNAKRDLITLEEELKFVRSYMFLINSRVGKGVHFQMSIHKDYLKMLVPPLTMQILIENALKHNKTVKSNPLVISIRASEGEELLVSNTMAPLDKQVVSSGIGLNNIINRYKLLSDKIPVIVKEEGTFLVRIPLLDPTTPSVVNDTRP